jgi:hypothetical protein
MVKAHSTIVDIKSNILSSKEVVFFRRDFNQFGNHHAIDTAIRSLLKQKSLLRSGRGIYIRNHCIWTKDKIVHVICKRLGNRVNRTLLYGYTKIHIGKTVTYFSAIERLDKFRLRIAQTVLEHYPIHEIRSYCLKILSDWKANGVSYVSNIEWENIMLNGTDDEVIYAMTSEDQEPANRLRQSSPYIGMLSAEHMDKLRQEMRSPHLL